MSDDTAAARAQYGRQASAYTVSHSHAQGADLARLISLLAFTGAEEALDVATGTGHTALAIAPHCARVTGVDPTPEMLREAEELARSRAIANVHFVQGTAEHLPFIDACFDVVTVRRAPHHFASIPMALAEMRRVLRPGGRLGLVDQITPDDPEGSNLLEAMERRRDPSHRRALTVAEWQRVLAEAGFTVRHVEVDEEIRDIGGWLDLAGTPPEACAAIMTMLLTASEQALDAINYRPDPAPEGSFLKQRIVVLATR
jgi:ubiquinone/menaquinone biosynthesis C-methylase UbiE